MIAAPSAMATAGVRVTPPTLAGGSHTGDFHALTATTLALGGYEPASPSAVRTRLGLAQ